VSPSPNARPISDDPLRGPLRLIVFGLALTAGWAMVAGACFSISAYSGGYAVFKLLTLTDFVYLAGAALTVAGLAQIAQQNRPGRDFAIATTVVNALTVVATAAWLVISLASLDLGALSFRVFEFTTAIVDAVALFMLARSLRSLASSRARSFDGVFIFVCIVIACGLVQALVDASKVLSVPPMIGVLMLLAVGGARIALAVGAQGIAASAPLADPAFDHGTAYRGPGGAIATPPAVEGSIGLGFCAGLFGGCLGFVLVLALAKGQRTKRGAGIGFACQALLGIIVQVALQSSQPRRW
jgi:hypothetical protein